MNIDLGKTQRYMNWFNKLLHLDSVSNNGINRIVKRGETYWCDFGLNIGSEISKTTPRPCVIVQCDIANSHSGNVTICAITHTSKNIPCFVPIGTCNDNNGNTLLEGYINVSTITSVSKVRLGKKILPYKLSTPIMNKVEMAIAQHLDYLKYYKELESKLASKNQYINKLKAQRNQSQDQLKEFMDLLEEKDFEEAKNKLIKLLDNS